MTPRRGDGLVLTPYYEDAGIAIYHGDCREVLPTLGKFDLLLTDPPYGVTNHEWDSVEAVSQVVGGSRLSVFTTGERLLAQLITAMPAMFRHVWVWDRVNRNTDFLNSARRPMRCHELIAVFSRSAMYEFNPVMRPGDYVTRRTQGGNASGGYGEFGTTEYGVHKRELYPRSIVAFPGNKTNTQLHPNEKPVALFSYLLQSYPADITVDPFMGSGTTLLAAKLDGRKAIGIELEERYCEIAANRLSQKVLPFIQEETT